VPLLDLPLFVKVLFANQWQAQSISCSVPYTHSPPPADKDSQARVSLSIVTCCRMRDQYAGDSLSIDPSEASGICQWRRTDFASYIQQGKDFWTFREIGQRLVLCDWSEEDWRVSIDDFLVPAPLIFVIENIQRLHRMFSKFWAMFLDGSYSKAAQYLLAFLQVALT
jgi:hypothetical protein